VTVGQNGNCNISRQACTGFLSWRDWVGIGTMSPCQTTATMVPSCVPFPPKCMLSATSVMCQLDLYLGFYFESHCLQLCLLCALFKTCQLLYMTIRFQVALITQKIFEKIRVY